MSIYFKVRAVEKVFRQLEKEINSFQKDTGMHCLPNCGKCCTKPDISASPLEFLPLAYHLFKNGEAMEWYEKLRSSENTSICSVLLPFNSKVSAGFCSRYAYRGLICRLFGFSATRDKNGIAKLVTCQPIKTELPLQYQKGLEKSESGEIVFMRDYYFRLSVIDADLGREMMPINQAIKRALEAVMAYYSYRRIRKAG